MFYLSRYFPLHNLFSALLGESIGINYLNQTVGLFETVI